MSLATSDRSKRTASSPLSDGEEIGDPRSRRSRMKRINLTDLVAEEQEPPSSLDGGHPTNELGIGNSKLDCMTEIGDGQTIPPPASESAKEPATLESLSGKIDQILGYLVANKSELSTINRRHESRLRVLEVGHNEVVDKFEQVTGDISANATQIARNSTNIESNETCISTLKTQLRICKATNEEFINRFRDMDLELKQLKAGYVENKRSILDLGLDVRERRLALSGVAEKDGEDPVAVALTAVNKIMTHALNESKNVPKPGLARPRLRTLKLADMDNVYRLGKLKRKAPRPLIITFSFTHIRQMVLAAKEFMKNLDVKYYLNEDLYQDAKDHRANLKAIADGGKNLGHDTRITGNKILIDSEVYQPDELDAVSPTILHAAKRERLLENGIAFRGDRSIFSNFFPSPITIDDVEYSSVEQYFQHEKAIQCGFPNKARKIMYKSNPWYIKVVSNQVEINEDWKKNRLKILYKGIVAKFEQNIPLRQALLNSVGLNLYEATTDLFYACGIDLDSPKWITGDWPGQNATGKILMKVREELLSEDSLTDSLSDNTLPLNLTSDLGIVEAVQEASHNDELGPSPMDTNVQSGNTSLVEANNEWPTPEQASSSFTDVVKLTAAGENSTVKPKLNKSLPQVTHTPKKSNPNQQRRSKTKFPPPDNTLSRDDAAFLEIHPRKGSGVGNKKSRRRQVNTTSTPSRNKSGLSPGQQAAIKYLGLPPESEYVRNIVSSQNKQK